MSESKPLSRQFDDAAQLYDEVRPRYPEEIIKHIIAFAALPAQGRVFEGRMWRGANDPPVRLTGVYSGRPGSGRAAGGAGRPALSALSAGPCGAVRL
jgi:hypothetical protein